MTREEEIEAAWTQHQRRPREANLSDLRLQLANDQANECHYCGHTMTRHVPGEPWRWSDLTLDHKHPRCLGGGDEAENLVASCSSCNMEKGEMEYDRYMRYIGRLEN